MDGTRPQHPLTDSQLNRELESALGVDPSPEFLARVRTRVAAEPEVSMWRQALWGRRAQPAVAIALVSVLLAVVVPRLMRDGEVRKTTPIVAAVTGTPVEADRSSPALGEGGRVGSVEQTGRTIRRALAQTRADSVNADSVNTVPLQLSPVLFSEDDRAAFALFVTAVADGRVPEKVVQALGEDDMAPLAIAPLAIAPLPALARENRQGEGQW